MAPARARAQRTTRYLCPECGIDYQVKADRDSHLLQYHPAHPDAQNVPTYTCEECGIVLLDKSNFKRHINNVHNKGRIFCCRHCQGTETGSVGKRSDNLKRHTMKCPRRPTHLLPEQKDESDKPELCRDQAELDAKRQTFRARTTQELPELPPAVPLPSPLASPVMGPAGALWDEEVIDASPLFNFNTPITQSPLTPATASSQQQAFEDMPVDPVLLGSADANILAGDMPTMPQLNTFDSWRAATELLEQVSNEMNMSNHGDVLFRFIELMFQRYPMCLHGVILQAKEGIDEVQAMF